ALKNLVDTIAFSYADLLGEQLTDEHRQRCLRVCEETIEYFNTILRDPGTTIQVRRSVQAHINQLNWLADQFSRLGNQVVGGDLNQGVKWQNLENAFAGNIQTGCVINQRHKDPTLFLQASRDIVINKVQSVLRDLAGLKVNVEFFCTFRKHQQDIEKRKSFITKSREILPATSLQDWYTEHVYEKLKQRIEDFEHEGSGWSRLGPTSLMVTMSRFAPTQVGNPPSSDCRRISSGSMRLRTSRTMMSSASCEIPTIHLLMIKKSVNYTNNLDNIESVYHFAWIHNLSGLIKSQISLGRHRLYFCDRCLNHFKFQKCYLEHR
ncbi:Protein of unknown function, partial [Cotesia congregata]